MQHEANKTDFLILLLAKTISMAQVFTIKRLTMEKIIEYLKRLRENNNREWFQENKKTYEIVRREFTEEIQGLIDRFQFAYPALADLKASDAMFRIYRDIRFSNDKTPYKPHFSAFLARGGRKSREAGYYIHIDPEGSFYGSGVYSPEKEELLAIRQEIIYAPEKFIQLVEKGEKDGFQLIDEDKLKMAPKGFPKDSPHIDLVKYKHYFLTAPIPPEALKNGNFQDILTARMELLLPFNEYLNMALELKGNE